MAMKPAFDLALSNCGFEWIFAKDEQNGRIASLRKSECGLAEFQFLLIRLVNRLTQPAYGGWDRARSPTVTLA